MAIELERSQTLANGACIELVVFITNPNPRRLLPIACRHVMRGEEPDEQAIEGGARQLGAVIARQLRLEVGNDAADMLREAI